MTDEHSTSGVRDSLAKAIAKARAQFQEGIPFTDDQCVWLMRTIELEADLIDASNAYIKELGVSSFKKDIEIHELKEALTANGQDSPRN